MGNQLFQFAACKALLGVPSNTVTVDSRRSITWGRPLESCLKDGATTEISQIDLLKFREVPHLTCGQRTVERNWSRLSKTRYLRAWKSRYVFQEQRRIGFDEGFESVHPPVLLQGYFQSELYFQGVRSEIVSSFKPPSKSALQFMELAQSGSEGRHIVGISLRQGIDYRQFHFVLPSSYYQSAIRKLPVSPTECSFIIFGDSKETNLSTIECVLGAQVLRSAHHLNPVDQLNVMSMLDTLIIPNSSFAWWGAWLGDLRRNDHRRMIIAPDPWLSSDDDIVPSRWIKVRRD